VRRNNQTYCLSTTTSTPLLPHPVEICMRGSELIVYLRCGYWSLYTWAIAALNNPNTPDQQSTPLNQFSTSEERMKIDQQHSSGNQTVSSVTMKFQLGAQSVTVELGGGLSFHPTSSLSKNVLSIVSRYHPDSNSFYDLLILLQWLQRLALTVHLLRLIVDKTNTTILKVETAHYIHLAQIYAEFLVRYNTLAILTADRKTPFSRSETNVASSAAACYILPHFLIPTYLHDIYHHGVDYWDKALALRRPMHPPSPRRLLFRDLWDVPQ